MEHHEQVQEAQPFQPYHPWKGQKVVNRVMEGILQVPAGTTEETVCGLIEFLDEGKVCASPSLKKGHGLVKPGELEAVTSQLDADLSVRPG